MASVDSTGEKAMLSPCAVQDLQSASAPLERVVGIVNTPPITVEADGWALPSWTSAESRTSVPSGVR